jgi:hypothetical protein
MEQLLAQLPGDPIANAAVVGSVLLALLDFVMGSVRAGANGTFSIDRFSTWGRAQILGHVVPITLMLTFGQVIGTITIGTLSLNVLVIAGLAHAATFAATEVASIIASANPQAADVLPAKAT